MNVTSVPVSVTAPLGTPFVTLNGQPATRGDDLQTFTAQVPLNEGLNSITAIAFPFGQRAGVTIVRDTTPPKILAMTPSDGRTLLGPTVTFQGILSEPATISISSDVDERDGHSVPILAPVQPVFADQPLKIDTFEFPDFALESGLNQIDITLTDAAGNEADVPITLTQVDSTLAITAPANGSSVNSLETTLQLQAFAQVVLDAVYVGGSQLSSLRRQAINPGTFELDHVPIVPGPNDIRVVYEENGSPQQVLVSTVTSTVVVAPAPPPANPPPPPAPPVAAPPPPPPGSAPSPLPPPAPITSTPDAPITALQGLITDAATGSPLPGATVKIDPTGAAEIVVTTSNAGAFYALIPPGPYAIEFDKEGFETAGGTAVAPDGMTVEIDFAMLRWSTDTLSASSQQSSATSDHLAGVVTTASDSQPLAGALVDVVSSGGSLSAITAADGSFDISGIPLGPFSASFSKVGFMPITYQIDNTEAVDVRLTPALQVLPASITIVGTVTSGITGNPEPGVRTTVVGSAPGTTVTTDASGRYVLSNVALGQQTIHFEEAGFQDGFAILDAEPTPDGSPKVFDMTFPSKTGKANPVVISSNAQGTVRDLLSGAPIPGATVTTAGQTVTSDAGGHFQLHGLPQAALAIVATAPNHGSQTILTVVVPNGPDSVDFQLRSTARGFVTGSIVDATTGQPVGGALVKIAGSHRLMAETTGVGSYTIAIVPPGIYSLEITQPSYAKATVAGVTVVDQQGTTLNASLLHRPTSGALQGKVTNLSTGAAVVGALVSADSGQSATSQADGTYRLDAVPAGMVSLTIHATGFSDSARATAVTADADPNAPSVTAFDIALDNDTGSHEEASADISAASGGSISLHGGRLLIDIPPYSLTDDATVDVRLADTPHSQRGQPLALDPSLDAPEIRAIGPELSVRLESKTPGDPAPKFLGPIVLTLRYPGADASTAGIDEQTLFPFWFDGTEFTLLRSVPYFYAVDDVDKKVVVALDFTSTEAGTPVEVASTLKGASLLADLTDPNQAIEAVREFFITLGSKVAAPFSTAGAAQVVSLDDANVADAVPVHVNALPLFVFHGWSIKNILFANALMDANGVMQDPGYGAMVTDLRKATNGVYRPIFVSYNPRAPVAAAMNEVFRQLQGELGNGGSIHGQLPPDNPNGKALFTVVDAFGYSKGALAERELQCGFDIIDGMVAIAGQHHGAFQNLEIALTALKTTDVPIRALFDLLSPGTSELLDYPDGAPSVLDPNPYLSELNTDPCSAPKSRLSLIAGTDSTSFLSLFTPGQLNKVIDGLVTSKTISNDQRTDLEHIANILSLGGLASSPFELNDSVVPLSSATARTHSGDRISAFDGLSEGDSLTEHTDPFNHITMGQRGSAVEVANILDQVLPPLTDWVVQTATTRPQFTPPSLTNRGSYSVDILVDYHIPNKTISALLAVVYGKDPSGNWHVLQGADPKSLLPSESASDRVSIVGTNSQGLAPEARTVKVRASIEESADDPNTNIRDATVLLLDLPIAGSGEVPEDPTTVQFGVPTP